VGGWLHGWMERSCGGWADNDGGGGAVCSNQVWAHAAHARRKGAPWLVGGQPHYAHTRF
jgi:hypothetical protein